MDLAAIHHRSAFTDCYAPDRDTMVLNVHTGKEVTAVTVLYEDPYAYGISGDIHWVGIPKAMEVSRELKYENIWTVRLQPMHKRLQYYFEITCGEETLLMFEDDFYTREAIEKSGRLKQYFKFPFLNAADVSPAPGWVEGTVWYQIMPDRFCRGDDRPKRMPLKDWYSPEPVGGGDFYGGDLRGIISRLPWLKELGISGIYLLPLFLSDTNHKYNTFDYTRIDPDFGTEEDVVELVRTAHSLGIRVMLDAVFNHSGTGFAPWQDVWEKGEASEYYDWFCINRKPFERRLASLADGRFFGFAFLDTMPKLNTGNPEVVRYFTQLCTHWVQDWDIDGIRFDVGNEVSHSFLKQLNRALKPIKPELFLLGEIWHDSIQWLQGDEYDSVMNYPFFESIQNFWVDAGSSARDLMYAVNRVYSLYPEQTNRILFNFLDTHDTMRAVTRCGDMDRFYQQLVLLMTLPGSACIYYGTEIAMPGGHDPDCRRPMPWAQIEAGKYDAQIDAMKTLIAIRRSCPAIRGTRIEWHPDADQPRLVCYDRTGNGSTLRVLINGSTESAAVTEHGKQLFARGYSDGLLAPGGAVIFGS